ncbi:MAG: hypothetical protein LBL62_08320 [Planctomycetaceae bacterium]|jgi:hypothetical protein|nr:hypothetical protein [Planctomycetaceae bacterium]
MTKYKRIGIIFVIALIMYLLGYMIRWEVTTRIIVIEHVKTHPNIPKEAKDICFSSQYKDYFWEAEIDIEYFDQFVNSVGGYSVEFNIKSPIRIGRYTILKASKNRSKQPWIELKHLLPENENNLSCFHFVKHGRIGFNTGQMLIVYDNDNLKAYVIRRGIVHTSKGTCLLYNPDIYLETLAVHDKN